MGRRRLVKKLIRNPHIKIPGYVSCSLRLLLTFFVSKCACLNLKFLSLFSLECVV